jgi:hypothetical protein
MAAELADHLVALYPSRNNSTEGIGFQYKAPRPNIQCFWTNTSSSPAFTNDTNNKDDELDSRNGGYQ